MLRLVLGEMIVIEAREQKKRSLLWGFSKVQKGDNSFHSGKEDIFHTASAVNTKYAGGFWFAM